MEKLLEIYDAVTKWKLGAEAASKRLNITKTEYEETRTLILDTLKLFQPVIDEHAKKTLVQLVTTGQCPTKSKILLDSQLANVNLKPKVTEMHRDMDTGKMKLEAIAHKEPKSAEEIIELLKIDITKWKLSQYWNKEKAGYWLVSALVTQLNKEEADAFDFFEILKDYQFPKVEPIIQKVKKQTLLESGCGVISLQDLHFGKSGNENMTNIMLEVVNDLLSKSAAIASFDNVVLVIGGDCLNVDTFNNTTTKGTPVQNSMTAQDSYIQAFEGLYILLQLLKEYSDKVNIVFVPGNHDRLSSFHLVHALSKSFDGVSGYTFYSKYSERKVLVYGENMFCFEHGDVSRKTTPLVYATEYPTEWGNTTYRTLFTGHMHQKRTTEYVTDNEVLGFTTKILPSLSATDYWHYHNKYIGNKRAAVLELYHKDNGKIAEFQTNYKL